MKNLKKFISVFAVLSVSATAALSAVTVAGCQPENAGVENDKLITVDENHSANVVSTARGEVQTVSSGRIYYVSPEGDSENDGLSWDKTLPIDYLLRSENVKLQAGDTVYVKPGTYSITSMVTVPESVSGEYNSYIRIVNAALEKEESGYTGTETLATLDFSKMYFGSAERGVQLYGSYIYWYGIDVCGAGDNGLYIGGNYNTVEYCEFYNNRDTGLQLGRSESGKTTIDQWPSYNLVKNCTSHNNYDNETYGENADGFAAKLTVGYGNVFDGCIAYRNSDDGWDLYAKSDSGNIGCVIIYNCVAFENGYLEYTQADNNARFENFNDAYTETFKDGDDKRYFRTRDGDGNGFKLGGSVMEGDVVLYNCLAYLNRMHGVTDNSNPGFLKVEGVTSYDNSAAVDDNPDSETFGQIVARPNHDTHGNINVSRQTYSYNSVLNTLSVKSSYAKSLEKDEYRGSVTDSLLVGDGVTNVVIGSIDADSKLGYGSTATRSMLKPEDVFKSLPFTVDANGKHTYNLSGLKDLYASGNGGALKADRVHVAFRNPDGSVNMKEILAKKDGVDADLIAGKSIGSELDKGSWEDYTHFYNNDFVNGDAATENAARLDRAIETLTVNTDEKAVYQDFEAPVKMFGCTIEWASENPDLVEVGEEVEISGSDSRYITVRVYRPLEADVKVRLTATITCGTGEAAAVGNKVFELNIKRGTPTIGAIKVLTPKGETVAEGGAYVLDQYSVFTEPEVLVENGIDYHGKLLKPDQYTCETTYMYAADKNSPFVEIKGFTPSNAGVYSVTKIVTLKSDGSKRSMTYTMYVSSGTAKVDFVGAANVTVTRDGFGISGNLSNATGKIYALSSTEQLALTAENIKTVAGVKAYEFRDDKISFTFENSNSAAYYVYYALSNLNGEITSQIYEAQVGVTEINSEADFAKVAGGAKLAGEEPSKTIYLLTRDLDFNNRYSSGTAAFVGLLNGAGHTVRNIRVVGGDKTGVFVKVEGGTIENIKFENVVLSGGKQTGIVSQAYGGYYHNISLKNVKIVGGERTGGLIGQAFEGYTEISYVSLINDNETDYIVSSGAAKRAGGLIGLIQTTSGTPLDSIIHVTDCYVAARIYGSEGVGGMVGAMDNARTNINYKLTLNRCYFGGLAESTYTTPRVGGMIGYQSSNVGNFEITNCISVGRLVNQGNPILVPLKTASLIVGGFSSAAVNVVSGCISIMEEYNSDYGVDPYPVSRLVESVAEIEELLGDAYDDWTLVFEDGSDERLQAPYLRLNFLN